MNGAQALVHILEKNGVDTIFGYPGGANLPIYDALRTSTIKHVLARHEQGAIHMADGYARVAGRPGICLATSGPGATNLVTGLANAFLDSVPLIALTGQISRDRIGTDAFQEVDCFNITMPVTKHNELVVHESELVHAIKSAFYISNSGRKGPVLLDFPIDLLQTEYDWNFDEKIKLDGYNPTIEGNIGQIKRALKAIDRAERPIILFGGGIVLSNAVQEFLQFVNTTQIPVIRTLMGTGVISNTDPLYIGMVGSHGNNLANRIIHQDTDLIIAIGTRLGDRAIYNPKQFSKNTKLIHIDIDPAEIGKNVNVDIPIVGDIKSVLQEWNARLEKKNVGKAKPWIQVETKKTMLPKQDSAPVMKEIFEVLSKVDKKLSISTDVGRHQMWANHYCTNPNHLPLITSGGLGTMGFGLPAAIGAWFADPKNSVVSISGDGSFSMMMQEFIVASEHNIPLTVMLLNDSRLGMIRELQTIKYGKRFMSHDLEQSVDYVMLAQAMGGLGKEVKHSNEIEGAINWALDNQRPTLICFDLEKISL